MCRNQELRAGVNPFEPSIALMSSVSLSGFILIRCTVNDRHGRLTVGTIVGKATSFKILILESSSYLVTASLAVAIYS